ncbi:hypothetical protein [Jeongeupia chitinilytica]|uniref:Uncharacterized protein n=1 Tax=Jeongeupia chitinilytica TaxID=1041641 RepID=A0ABQ3GXB7_9NEIS|nr:hypothetical protein [Jeongeupia chitinilytica]GHD59811.1 hypothetical protein GCM10007350_11620 [Jeongeupia chitinilytica]
MHQVLEQITNELIAIRGQVYGVVPTDTPFGVAHGNSWQMSGLSRMDLLEMLRDVEDFISIYGSGDIKSIESRLQIYVSGLNHLKVNVVPQLWANPLYAVPAFVMTIDGLRNAVKPLKVEIDTEDAVLRQRSIQNKQRNLEATLRKVEPKLATLSEMVERIENAYQTAEQLPSDLESLDEARSEIEKLRKLAEADQALALSAATSASEQSALLNQHEVDAKSVLERCESAYSAATSVGLAAAFTERSVSLTRSMWVWVVGLIISLCAGGIWGHVQLGSLTSLLSDSKASNLVVSVNSILTVLSVGAPIWFAWISTKQIGQRFRLAEDYAFKASVSRAYEGFRKEVARFDKDMEARLLSSALSRLDELPLRLVEPDTHGSPWHELASSELVKQALKTVPGFGAEVANLASNALDKVGATVGSISKRAVSSAVGSEAASDKRANDNE